MKPGIYHYITPEDKYRRSRDDNGVLRYPSGKRVGRPPRPLLDRFQEHVLPEPNSGCWLWLSTLDRDGYGLFAVTARRTDRAQRFAYEQFVGPVPDGFVVDHLCRVRSCVNPAHLEAVTIAENTRRAMSVRPSVTHCAQGHEYTEDNTWRDKYGWRHCVACNRQRCRERYARRRAERQAA